ncbi:GMP reductase [bacterium]|nr:GMP reductase [bacterium]NDC95655.1 GMP reductase [bacterium]NDD85357.1 GMP reductase [bacterium]
MQKIINEIKLDFDDVLIRPKRSFLNSRSEVCIHREFGFKYSPRKLNIIPIMVANMDTVGTFAMAKTLSQQGLITCLHKHYSSQQYIDFYTSNNEINKDLVFYSVGTSEKDINKTVDIFTKIQEFKPYPNICLDVANGYTENFVKIAHKLRKLFPASVIMAGNVVTQEMTEELIMHGQADIVKVGIGSGSVCTTRLKTGVGYPQLSAVMECADAAHGLGGHVCSDGGCKVVGDICKAFGGNSDFVMLGSMFAGTNECEGEWQYDLSKKVSLKFYGMSSKEAMHKHYNGVAEYRTSEGKAVIVPYKGGAEEIVQDILGGLRSACTYIGATKIKDFGKKTTFIQVNNTHNRIFE